MQSQDAKSTPKLHHNLLESFSRPLPLELPCKQLSGWIHGLWAPKQMLHRRFWSQVLSPFFFGFRSHGGTPKSSKSLDENWRSSIWRNHQIYEELLINPNGRLHFLSEAVAPWRCGMASYLWRRLLGRPRSFRCGCHIWKWIPLW